jgi:hypothetical protein
MIVEKGADNLIGLPFSGLFNNSHFSNPCVIEDYAFGHKIKRIYYNTYDSPFLWYEQNLVEAKEKIELTIHTEYLE